MTITTATGKGAPLSVAEADENITDLDDRTALGWRDNIVALAIAPGALEAATIETFKGGIVAHFFPSAVESSAWATFHIDHDYAFGTKLYPHVHWAITSSETGTARFGIEYTVARGHGQDAFPNTTTVYVEQAANGIPYTHYVAEVSEADAIDGAALNVEPDMLIMCRFFRDGGHANDTIVDGVFVLCVDLHYQANRFATPYKAPDFINGP